MKLCLLDKALLVHGCLPDDFRDRERKACQVLLPGPTGWISTGCLKNLKSLHFPRELLDVEAISKTAKARVLRFEGAEQGGLRIRERANALGDVSWATCSLLQIAWVSGWKKRSFLLQLVEADNDLWEGLVGYSAQDPALNKRQGWQSRMATLFPSAPRESAQLHLRRRLDRWNMRTLPGVRVGRAIRAMEITARQTTPRVSAALLRLLCNGWCTSRRFQGNGHCRFECGASEDSIEHMSRCRCVRELFTRQLGLQPSGAGWEMDKFLCIDVSSDLRAARDGSVEGLCSVIKRRALGCYAIYRIHNGLRHGGFSHVEIEGAFARFLREGMRGTQDACAGGY